MVYVLTDYIIYHVYGVYFLTNKLLIFEFQRFHKELLLMVCNFVCYYGFTNVIVIVDSAV